MTQKEAQETYPGYMIKNRGYHSGDSAQYLYKSELNKREPIICLLVGIPFEVPGILQRTLNEFLIDSSVPLPAGVRYEPSIDRFQVPVRYFVKKRLPNKQDNDFATDAQEITSPLLEKEATILDEFPKSEFLFEEKLESLATSASFANLSQVDEIGLLFDQSRDIVKAFPPETLSLVFSEPVQRNVFTQNVVDLTNTFVNGELTILPQLIANLLLLKQSYAKS